MRHHIALTLDEIINEISSYQLGEEHEIWQLLKQTVRHVNAQHYSQKIVRRLVACFIRQRLIE